MTHTLRLWLLATSFAFIFCNALFSQIPTIQDCLGAIPICEPIYREDKVPNGMGNYPDEINRTISCLEDERNAIWYTFTVNETGNFGFVLIPNDIRDDYDWALYDLTNARCEDIRTNPNLLVSCNAAGQQGNDMTCIGRTGATGETTFNIQGAGCNNAVPTLRRGGTPLNALVPVQKGNIYVLVVSNWSRSTNGYTIDFSVSAGIGIFDQEEPKVTKATFPKACGDDAVSIEFNENIQCATVNNFNFVLEGPGGPYQVRLLSPVCDLGGRYTKSFDLLIEPAITTAGVFTLKLDGNRATEVLDLCNNPAINTEFSFEVIIDDQIQVELGEDITTCPNTAVMLDATVASPTANYLWSNGATTPIISVVQEGVYAVTVTDGCRVGRDLITVMYSEGNNLQVNLGSDRQLCEGETLTLDATQLGVNYIWNTGSTAPILTVNEPGTYAVTVSNACGSASGEVNISNIPDFELDLGENQELCAGETLELSVNLENVNFRWQDGHLGNSVTVNQSGTYWVEVSNTCFTRRDSITVNYFALPTIDLGENQTLCAGETLLLDAQQSGVTYQWQDGSNKATFEVNSAGIYEVTLSNRCGTASDEITISVINDFVLDLGENIRLCEGESQLLEANIDTVNYRWSNGQTNRQLTVNQAGIYWLEANNECFTHRDTVEVAMEFLPNLDLGLNKTICPDETLLLAVNEENVTYRWQDGSTNASFEVRAAGIYTLTVANDCGAATDSVTINQVEQLALDLGEDQIICNGQSLILDAGQQLVTYQWQDGSDKSQLEVKEAGRYFVTIKNECETITDEVIITECQRCEIYIPNVFSPNADGANDVFRPYPNCELIRYDLQIFDRWGTLVFQSNSLEQGWSGFINGQIATNGVYVWHIRYTVTEDDNERNAFDMGELVLLK
jgi:gliding motility-associated-like protein